MAKRKRKARGWSVFVEPSGPNHRCRWRGCYGVGQIIFLDEGDAEEYKIKKKRAFERRDAGLEELPSLERAREAVPDYAAFRADYLRSLKERRSESTVLNATWALDLWEEFAGQVFPILKKEQLLRRMQHRPNIGFTVQDFCSWLMTRPAKRKAGAHGHRANGVRIVLRHFRAAVRWGHREGYTTYDPFHNFELPAGVAVAKVITPAVIIAILRELPERARVAVYFALHTGLRVSEVVRMDWKDIEVVVQPDPDAPRVMVEKWYLTVVKSKTRRGKPPETKTQRIHPNVVRVLGPRQTAGPLFPSKRRPGQPIRKDWHQHQLRAAVVKLGMGSVRWHDLRHTWATSMMDDVRDLKALMDAGGWGTEYAAMVYQHGTQRRVDSTAEVRSHVPPEEAMGNGTVH